jgi:predicted tellurium resistance membrane protein TerC
MEIDLSAAIVPLLTLIALEVILGIDNIIFISILADRLPEAQRRNLRLWGLGLSLVMRLLLLLVVSWIMHLDKTLFTVWDNDISGKDLILLGGGLFLLYKATKEIYHKAEDGKETQKKPTKAAFGQMLVQVIVLDLVFSVDSIITAVGMVDELWIMYTAVIITVVIMVAAARPISNFITRHPSFKVLALCFLMMIGVALLAEGLDFKIPKGYIYFAMGFSFFVDILQMSVLDRKKK